MASIGGVDFNQRDSDEGIKDVHALMVNDVHHLLEVERDARRC